MTIESVWLAEDITLDIPDGYYLKEHQDSRNNSISLIRHQPHVYVAQIYASRTGDYIATFMEANARTKHVMIDTNPQALLVKACAYDRLTSTKG